MTRKRKMHSAQFKAKVALEARGRLQMELEWLQKDTRLSVAERRAHIEAPHPELSLHRQCQLLGLARASLYCARWPRIRSPSS